MEATPGDWDKSGEGGEDGEWGRECMPAEVGSLRPDGPKLGPAQWLGLLSLPYSKTWGQETVPVWMPYFGSSRESVTVNDSILLDNNIVIGVARSLLTPRDVHVLGTREDNRVVTDAMALNVQSVTSVASVGHC
ncbi:PREDICTED: LOC109946288 [Prunus dulcis]|uniref:PREDICTED: LOC109946288 n=1 Tax=Prunus dulcis TaxID=3755 RepID=A0A5E4FJ50_PRUDU|nr:hypothetical protein L3X38_023730 [Prunus dulcis]VVA28204.1 PREDICTED: LOC109946288 [Prunus dulcis]